MELQFLSPGQAAGILLPLLAFLGLVIWACVRIARKTGYSGWWGVASAVVPFVGLVTLWRLAFIRWPALDRKTS